MFEAMSIEDLRLRSIRGPCFDIRCKNLGAEISGQIFSHDVYSVKTLFFWLWCYAHMLIGCTDILTDGAMILGLADEYSNTGQVSVNLIRNHSFLDESHRHPF